VPPSSRAAEQPSSRAAEQLSSQAVGQPLSSRRRKHGLRRGPRSPSRSSRRRLSRAAERPSGRVAEQPSGRAAEQPSSQAAEQTVEVPRLWEDLERKVLMLVQALELPNPPFTDSIRTLKVVRSMVDWMERHRKEPPDPQALRGRIKVLDGLAPALARLP